MWVRVPLSLRCGMLTESRRSFRPMPRSSAPLRSVLVVEDDWDIREVVADVLRDAGRTVDTARDGLEALKKLDSVQRPCLVVLDLMMPRLDGIGFLRELAEHPLKDDFIVLVMACSRGSSKSICTDGGASRKDRWRVRVRSTSRRTVACRPRSFSCPSAAR